MGEKNLVVLAERWDDVRVCCWIHFQTAKPSLRAQAKQSIVRHKERMDCFVASAPRNDVERWVRDPAARCARVVHVFRAQKKEGVGNAGRQLRPQPRVQKVESTRVVTASTAGNTRHSRTQWF
jgi:hypothetical protein